MEYTTCPECSADVVSAGMALWADGADAVMVFECVEPECSWADVEYEVQLALAAHGFASAA